MSTTLSAPLNPKGGVKVLITGKMTDEGLNYLKKGRGLIVDYRPGLKGEDLFNAVKDCSALIIRTETAITRELLTHTQKLELICRSGIGVDHIDLDACSEKQIVVMNTPSANRVSTAEHTMGLIFALSRHVVQASNAIKAGVWNRELYQGTELQMKTLGIIGLGNIGQRVATRALALHMQVIASDPYLDHSVASSINVKLYAQSEVLAQSDFVTMHVPLTPETTDMANAAFFNQMKESAYFINASRGAVVDEAALLDALNNGSIAGAALDVMKQEPPPANHPLFKSDKIILTPHIAGQTFEAQHNMAMDAAVQVRDFFEEGTIINAVLRVENQPRGR